MNSLQKTIKTSVLFSLIAIGATLAGCASRSSSTTGSGSTVAASTSSSSTSGASDSSSSSANSSAGSSTTLTGAASTGGATTTNGIDGQGPINYDDLIALIKKGTMANVPSGQ